VYEIFNRSELAHHRPIRGYIQIVKIFVYSVACILVISAIVDKDPTVLLAGLGAMAAVLILIFKDTILGFVASIQISVNDMVKIGDWIELPKHNANGHVIDITLNTVKIRNFDNSISTIPTYSMVSESFINWKGLEIAEGRRIKRAVFIDLGSIKICTPEMLERFSKFNLIKDYITEKQTEILKYNVKKGFSESDLLSGRRQTNIGVFRKYLEMYLNQHPMVNKEMPLLVRQLETTGKGLPVEIYLFCKDKTWENFEMVQADIFDNVFSVIPLFDLKIFQEPTSVKIIE
jgi:miniconductance mechanosensitive channel